MVALLAVLAQRGRSRHVVRLSLLRSCHGALFLCAGYDAGGKGGGRGRKKREVEEEERGRRKREKSKGGEPDNMSRLRWGAVARKRPICDLCKI